MANGSFLGKPQPFYYPTNHPELPGYFKGMKVILEERGIDTTGMKGQCNPKSFKACARGRACCMRRTLFNEPDFVEGKSKLEKTCEINGVQAIFLPKFHCELNFIEQCWGYAKRKYRLYPPSSDEKILEINVKKALEEVPLITMCCFANRSLRFMDAYAQGANGVVAAWASDPSWAYLTRRSTCRGALSPLPEDPPTKRRKTTRGSVNKSANSTLSSPSPPRKRGRPFKKKPAKSPVQITSDSDDDVAVPEPNIICFIHVREPLAGRTLQAGRGKKSTGQEFTERGPFRFTTGTSYDDFLALLAENLPCPQENVPIRSIKYRFTMPKSFVPLGLSNEVAFDSLLDYAKSKKTIPALIIEINKPERQPDQPFWDTGDPAQPKFELDNEEMAQARPREPAIYLLPSSTGRPTFERYSTHRATTTTWHSHGRLHPPALNDKDT
ncbi:hypothetical protein DL96DRAFT_1711759 [Flagelloscypha sp. PMI_526]|nr:hypothetical protein DL96DRAFT_1711759 [Flagelloscypha sp. PMI_526]